MKCLIHMKVSSVCQLNLTFGKWDRVFKHCRYFLFPRRNAGWYQIGITIIFSVVQEPSDLSQQTTIHLLLSDFSLSFTYCHTHSLQFYTLMSVMYRTHADTYFFYFLCCSSEKELFYSHYSQYMYTNNLFFVGSLG